MKKQHTLFPLFLTCLVLSVLILLMGRVPLFSGPFLFFQNAGKSAQAFVFETTSHFSLFRKSLLEHKKDEQILDLQNKLVDQEKLIKENHALFDQFQTTIPFKPLLLPAKIIGAPAFIPSITFAQAFVLDKGSADHVAKGQVVLYKNNLVGIIDKVALYASTVDIVSKKNFSSAAKTAKTRATGIIKGIENGEMILENVVSSQTLEKGDFVVTFGDMSLSGKGIPPDIILGQIESVEQKASALFQSAKVKSLLDFASLSTVFIVIDTQR